MVFSGSLVTYGRGVVVITAVGMKTELGKIASLMKETIDKATPLQVSLDNFGKKLSISILVLCGIVFAINIYHGVNILESLLFAVGNQSAYSLDIKSGLWTLLYFQIDAVQILEFKYSTSSQTVVSGLLCRETGSIPWFWIWLARVFAL